MIKPEIKGIGLDSQGNILSDVNREMLENAYLGYQEDIESAVSRGADVNIVAKGGWTALMFAAKKGYANCVKTLLELGADVNAKAMDGRTTRMALLEAANRTDVIKLLVEHGADCRVLNDLGQTPLILACHNDFIKLDVIKTLIGKSSIDHQDHQGYTALMFLASHNPKECELYVPFLEHNADIELKSHSGKTVSDILLVSNGGYYSSHVKEVLAMIEKAREFRKLNELIQVGLDDNHGLFF